MKRATSVFGLILVLALLVNGCVASPVMETPGGSAPATQPGKPEDLVIWHNLQHGMDDGLDPIMSGWGVFGESLLFSSLLHLEDDFSVSKDLATDYTISDDGLIWTFKLRDDAVFTDGQPLTAADILYTYNTLLAGESAGADLSMVEAIKVLGDHDLEITLTAPAQPGAFMHNIGIIGITPQHLREGNEETFTRNPVGSGPYQLVRWDDHQQLVLEANPTYYGEQPYFKRIISLLVDEDTAMAMALAGDLHLIKLPPKFAGQQIESMYTVHLNTPWFYGMGMPTVPNTGETTAEGNPIGNDVTADPAIRRAIAYAVDREAIIQGAMGGNGTPIYGPGAVSPWANAEAVFEDGNLDRAKQLLAEAGWLDSDGDGVLEKEGLKAEFDLLYSAAETVRQGLALAVADAAAPIGIKINPVGLTWDEIGKVQSASAVLWAGGGSTPQVSIYSAFHSDWRGQGWYNPGYYSNPTVDQYMDQARTAQDEAEARKYWQLAQSDGTTGIVDDMPWVWLMTDTNNYLVTQCLDIGEGRTMEEGGDGAFPRSILQWRWRCP